MAATIRSVETIVVSLPRETPYLGPLGEGEHVNERGYFVRRGNRTIYPTTDRSAIVKVIANDGTVGWGETYGIVAPQAVLAIISDVLGPLLVGREAVDIPAIWDELYALMRVRGHWSGFFTDAIAGVDIALWDLAGKLAGRSVADMLGGPRRARIPAYASGLPRASLAERVALAQELAALGFRGIKFAAVISQQSAQQGSHQSVVDEMSALRLALGNEIEIMIDLHWKYTPTEAITLIRALEPYRPYFAEAPCAPEDIDGQADVVYGVNLLAFRACETLGDIVQNDPRHALPIIPTRVGAVDSRVRPAHFEGASSRPAPHQSYLPSKCSITI